MSKDTGGPAFPVGYGYAQADEVGMTLRDYFAAQAAAGLGAVGSFISPEIWARTAYEIADAMLAERNK